MALEHNRHYDLERVLYYLEEDIDEETLEEIKEAIEAGQMAIDLINKSDRKFGEYKHIENNKICYVIDIQEIIDLETGGDYITGVTFVYKNDNEVMLMSQTQFKREFVKVL